MNKRKVRDVLRLVSAMLFLIIYLPHLFCYAIGEAKNNIKSDLLRLQKQISLKLPICVVLLYIISVPLKWDEFKY